MHGIDHNSRMRRTICVELFPLASIARYNMVILLASHGRMKSPLYCQGDSVQNAGHRNRVAVMDVPCTVDYA